MVNWKEAGAVTRRSVFFDSVHCLPGSVRLSKALDSPESQTGMIMIRIGLAHSRHSEVMFIIIHILFHTLPRLLLTKNAHMRKCRALCKHKELCNLL